MVQIRVHANLQAPHELKSTLGECRFRVHERVQVEIDAIEEAAVYAQREARSVAQIEERGSCSVV